MKDINDADKQMLRDLFRTTSAMRELLAKNFISEVTTTREENSRYKRLWRHFKEIWVIKPQNLELPEFLPCFDDLFSACKNINHNTDGHTEEGTLRVLDNLRSHIENLLEYGEAIREISESDFIQPTYTGYPTVNRRASLSTVVSEVVEDFGDCTAQYEYLDFTVYSNGTIAYQDQTLTLRKQMTDLLSLLVGFKTSLVGTTDIGEVLGFDQRDKATSGKYISELRGSLKKQGITEIVIKNTTDLGWKLKKLSN